MSEASDPYLGRIYGHCRLERKLGEGGMGMVYLSTHTTLNKLVAVKVLRSDLSVDPHAADRFLREARAAARVEHPSVVQVYDIGEQEGTFFIVMQYVEGQTLDGLLKKQETLPISEAIRIMKAVCEGVREAHQCGVIHRDIKPDNILLGKDGSVKLADFGLARAIEGDPNLSQTGRVFGTPHFMSPEQALGERVDQKSDIFSLGATFYRIATGTYPFQATTAMAVVYKLTHETPRPAKEVNPAVPGPVSDLIARMMARSPATRVGSVDEVLRRLDDLPAAVAAAATASGRMAKAGKVRPMARGPLDARGRRQPSRRRPVQAAALGLLALSAAGYLVLQRYGMLPSLEIPFATALTQRSAAPAPSPPRGEDSVAAARAAASLAAGQDAVALPPSGEGAEPAQRKVENPRPPAPKKLEPDPAAEEEKRALLQRTAQLLKDLEEDPERLSRYVDPQVKSERVVQLMRRMFNLLQHGRPQGAPPLVPGEASIEGDRLAGEVKVQGLNRPFSFRWVKRRGEWYLAPPYRRPEEKR